MADTGRDAFPDEAEPAFTLDEYMEDIEAVELVTYLLPVPPSSDSYFVEVDFCLTLSLLLWLFAERCAGGGFGAGRGRGQGVHLRRRIPQAPGRLLLPHLRAGWSRRGLYRLQPRLPRRA
jgi:hypothetical protein